MKIHLDHSNSLKRKHLMGLPYKSEVVSLVIRGRKHGGMLADMVLERQLRVLHLEPEAAGSHCPTGCGLGI